MKKVTKIFAIVLSLCLIFSICPLSAFAENVPEVVSIQCNDVVLSPSNGSFYNSVDPSTGETKSYYHYYVSTPVFSITFSDGVTVTSENSQVAHCGSTYTAYTYGDTGKQSYDNQWLPGNTYPVTCSIFSNTGENIQGLFNVTISESNIKAIELNDINIYDELDRQIITGYSNSQQKYVEYTNYNINASSLSGRVVFSDGKTQSFSYGGISYNNKYYSAYVSNPQSPDNVWEVGGTYPVTAVMDGNLTTFNVHICENPVESVEFDDVEVIESTTEYHYYPSATIKFKDGKIKTVEKGNSGLNFENNWYQFSFTDNQDEIPWEVGNTYTATGTIMGVSSRFNVTVIPTPLKSIQIKDVELYECLDGYNQTEWIYDPDTMMQNSVTYFRYNYQPSGTITFLDGTTKEFYGCFLYNNEWFSINTTDNQSNEHWEVGNAYTVTGTVMGISAQFNVTIKEIPFESFTADDVVLSTSELNRGYDIPTTYHFIRKDGSNYSVNGNQSVKLDDVYSCSIRLSDCPRYSWTLGEYEITATFGKLSTTFTVTASDTKSENGYSYLESKDGVIITGIDSNNSYISVPTTLSGKNVIGINSLGNAQETVKNLVIPNGIKFISSNIFSSSDLMLETLCLGKDIADFNAQMLECCPNLKNVYVDSENQYYTDDDGVLYNKSKSKLVWYPLGRSKKIELSSYIEDFSVLELGCYSDYSISFVGEGGNYITEDGVTYNADKTYIIFCDKEKSGSYIMPDSVLNIRNSAFKNCKSLTEVSISDSVAEIMYATFAGCDSLKNIDLPNNLNSLNDYAFSDCPSIESIVLPETIEGISNRCFANDESLNSINFPESICEIGDEAFNNTGFVELNLPSDEHYAGSALGIFADCRKLKTVTFAEGRRYIDDYMFSNCPALESVTMPDTVKYIYANAFSECTSLKKIKLSQGLTYLDRFAFAYSGIESIDIPNSVEFVGEGIFSHCENLATVNIGLGLESLSSRMFSNTAIEEITIPENVEYIGQEAFIDCSNLSNVVVENENAEIGAGAFSGCPLKNIPIPTNATVINGETYKGSKAKSVTIPNTVTDIMYGAFEDSTDLLDITMPTHLDSLGRAAFDNTSWYDTKPDGYITIDDYILYGYKGDYNGDSIVNIDKSISLLAGGVFENGLHGDTSEIERIIIPDGVKAIPENAFDGCTNLKSVTIPKSIESIYLSNDNDGILHSAFNNCPSLTDIYYLGTQQQWNELLYSLDRYRLPNATIHFIDEIVPFRISVEESQTKKVYEINENFKSDEFAIRVLFSDGTEKTLTDGFTVSGFDSSALGTNNLTVSYGELTCTCPITIEPHKIPISGNCGENIKWQLNLDKGILNITGNGNMYDFFDMDVPWYESLSNIKSVVFGADVSVVGKGVLDSLENLETITINGSKTVIQDVVDNFMTVIAPYRSQAQRYAIRNGYEFIAFPETIEIYAMPKQTIYALGEKFHSDGLTIAVCNPNGSVEYRYKGFEISGFDSTEIGKQTLTITYLGATTTFKIEVKEGILISNPDATDLTRLCRMLLDTETSLLSYDFNGDEVIDIRDLIRLKKYLVDDTTPLGKR